MEKIVNYVRNGKGLGLLFLLAISVLMTIAMLLAAKSFYGDMRPDVLLVANDFLPITVENNKIVSPANTYKRVDLKLGHTGTAADNFAIVLDTRDNATALPKNAQGVYIYKDTIYVASARKIQNYDLPNGVWDKDSFEGLLDSVIGVISGVIGVVLVVLLFISGLFKTCVAAILGLLAQKVMSREKPLDMSALMRLCAIGISAMEILLWGGKFVGIMLTGMQLFVILVLLELFFIFKVEPETH